MPIPSRLLWRMNDGKVTGYPGGYDYFLEKTGALNDEHAAITAG